MSLSRQEAVRMNSDFIEETHILLGLLAQEAGVASTVFKKLNVDVTGLARLARERPPRCPSEMPSVGMKPFAPDGKRVLELALEATKSLKSRRIDTGHLLIGWTRVEADTGNAWGLDLDALRLQAMEHPRPPIHVPGPAQGSKEALCPHTSLARWHGQTLLICNDCGLRWIAWPQGQEEDPEDLAL